MCGLAGQICFDTGRTTPLALRNMFLSQEARGKDSAGVAYLHEGEILTMKKAVSPRTFADVEITKKLWLEMAQSPILLMHARHATQGLAKYEENNHPVIACDWVVTHNGHVHNDDELVAYYGMTEERPADVDTVAINMALAQGETAEESLSHCALLGGTATFAAWNLTRPDEVVLARVNGPQLYLAVDRARQILYWSSDPDGLQFVRKRGLGALSFVDMTVMPQNSAFIIRPFTGEVKQFDLWPVPFHMPKLTTPKKEEAKKGEKTDHGPLATSFPRQDAQITGITSPLTGNTTSNSATVGFIKRSSDGITNMFSRWINRINGEGGDPVLLLTKTMSVSVAENYKDLGKPVPRFEVEMAGMVHLPLAHGEISTPYGKWFLTPNHRFFRGAKRVKTFWEQTLGPQLKAGIHLPATPILALALHDRYRLESVRVYYKNDGGETFVNGLMCPMCGIISLPRVWRDWEHVCAWCNVKSRAVVEAKDNAI